MALVKDWLNRTRITRDAIGEVLAFMRRDPFVPDHFANLDCLRTYLAQKRACCDSLVPTIWARYVRWLAEERRNRPAE
jgi:hypothetical protein